MKTPSPRNAFVVEESRGRIKFSSSVFGLQSGSVLWTKLSETSLE